MDMRIQLDSEWLIDCDEVSCNLVRLVTITGDNARGRQPKAENIGKQREDVVAFCGTMEQACQAFLNKKTQTSGVTTAQELLSMLREATAAVVAATKGIPRMIAKKA